ncbi:hypothetical protein BBJ28_00012224 [Nothophytophthora sp. Chile5]|nr:hypothetical protein BBJ28_00012224 [Nothophytophthora sp. Chile5]
MVPKSFAETFLSIRQQTQSAHQRSLHNPKDAKFTLHGRTRTEIPPQSFISLPRLPTMRAKETLQLRHQLACSGLSIRAATYDTKRHHVLTYDSHPLRPHMLRLFSLRREIKSVDLFDKAEEDKPDAGSAMQTAESASAEKKKLSYCQQQIQQQIQQQKQKQKQKSDSRTVVTSVTLIYAAKLDVYICVYASAMAPTRSTGPVATTYSVLLVEPASLRKLLLYSGPTTHRLKCSHYDHWSERLLLASHLETEDTGDSRMNGSTQMETQERLLGGQRNVVELLHISKRLEDGDASWIASNTQEQQQQKPPQRTLLCIEKVHAVQRHPDSLELICGSRGLRELYGAVGAASTEQSSDNGTAATTLTSSEGMLLEWRLNEPDDGKFVLVRRVALREAITAMTLSPCGDWLLVGLCKGGLKVWNVSGSRTNGSALFTIDTVPYEPTGDDDIATAQAEILSSIEISAASESSHSDSVGSATKSAEAMVITAERDTGAVRHWRLTVEERVFRGESDASDTLTHRLPRLELVGSFKTGEESKANNAKKSTRRGRKRALEPTLKTLVMCVNVDMGSCMENLLIVLREDVMHVLKVQTVLHVIHEFAAIEEVYSVRAITQRDESKVLCLSGSAASNLRVFPLGHRTAGTSGVSPPVQQLFIPPHSLGTSHIIAVESVVNGGKQTPFVVLAWSNGMVDVYDISQCKCVVTLHDAQLRSSGETEFLSCSLDMTVIQWQILGSGTVQEKRYFDIGGAVVDMVLVEEQAVVALAHEVCMFAFAPHSICATKYAAIGGGSLIATQRESSTEYPDTPTTRSIEDPTETFPSSRQTARSVDEYLTLHVPSMLPQPESASASSIPEQNSSGSVFALSTNDDDDGGSSRRHKAADVKPGSNQAHATSDDNQTKSRLPKFTRPSIDEKELRGYVEEYIFRHGTDGTVAAGRLTDLLALKPELPAVKRRGFALAKCLQELKVHTNTRVDAGEASRILTALFAAAPVSRPAFDGATAAHCGKQNQLQNRQIRMQKAHEREQARRKYAISYNILGEKYIRWEEAEEEQVHAVQSPSPTSSISHLVVRTPKSPPMRELTGPVAVTQSDESIFSFSRSLRTKESADASAAAPMTEEGEYEISGFQEDSDMVSPRAAWKANDSDVFSKEPSSKGDDGATAAIGITPVERNGEDRGKPAKKIKKVRHQKVAADRLVAATRVDDYLSKNGLVCNMKLSRMFREFWSKGYCWCEPAPKLHVVWKDQQGVDDHGGEPLDEKHGHEENPRAHGPTCELCQKRLHTVELPRRGYVPHFSRRATLAIILEVYSKLTASAHMRLYKKSASMAEGASELSIFGALFEVFKATYGMRHAVEAKLKLFLVSMCHFLRDHDAVAVFGELLGLHTPDDAAEHDRIPSDLVALIVCCYSWLYSREMVVRGNGFPGIPRGGERGRHVNAVITGSEAHPMTHGKSHWQFVQLGNALLCAQENLLYPLVSPAFLRNVLFFIEEYAQRRPTQPKRMDAEESDGDIGRGDNSRNGVGTEVPVLWIELHRFLRLLVGEWKHQNAEFRAAEQLFFAQIPPEVAAESELFEKLRLLLSCFVFYDHERVGVMAISDFESLLIKLRYLWPSEQMAADEATGAITAKDVSISFENAIFALRKRFVDLDCDGQLCYLDFWAMLYVVGIRTRTLIKFREMPSFCRDYKLEIPPELRDLLLKYMHTSCMLLLPTGLQVGASSLDHKAQHQHRRRVGGLHDGVFNLSKTLGQSLSTRELLANGGDAGRLGLFLDGAAPAIRQSASVTALERYRPLTVGSDLSDGRTDGALRHGGREPKVMGVRPTGPTPKPIASLSVSMLDQSSLSSNWAETNRVAIAVGKSSFPTSESDVRARALERNDPNGDGLAMTYASMYIQFPLVPPSRRRVGAGTHGEEVPYPATQIVGYISPDASSESDEDEDEWDDPLRRAQLSNSKTTMGQEKEGQHAEVSPTRRPPLTRVPSLRSIVSMEDEAASVDLTPRSSTAAADQLESPPRGPSLEKLVAIPSADKDISVPPANAKTETLRRQSSRDGRRVGFQRIRGDETGSQSEDPILLSPSSRHASMPIIPVVIPREATPPDTRREDISNDASGDDGSDDSNGDEARHDQDVEYPGVAAESVSDMGKGGTQAADNAALGLTVEKPEVLATSGQEAAEDNDHNDNSGGSGMLEQAPISPAMDEDNKSGQAEVVATTPAPIEDPVTVEEPADEVATSDLSEATEESQYPSATPLPVMKESNPLVHHTFRFSRQPAFLDSVAVNNTPFRLAMWNPNDDTDSDSEDTDRQDASKCDHEKNGEASRDREEEVESRDSISGKESPTNERHSFDTVQAITAPPSKASVTNKSSTGPILRRIPLQSHLRSTLESRVSGHMEFAIDEENDVSLSPGSSPLPKPAGRLRLNEDAERALYGGRVLNALGEGIAFSAEAEAAMQQKWQQFFDESESNMFSSLRRVLEKKQLDQREAEERQGKLRKKWQEQRDQDLQRLQQSRHNSAIMLASGSTSSSVVAASFRLQRIHRESCSQLNEELQYGVTVQGECKQAKAARHFHFHYFPDAHGSIITLKMHVSRGDAEVFMSTETKVPCATDFMWRSVQKLAQEPSDAQEGHKIMLYPHDLLRVVTAAAANAASSEQVAADLKANASTASLRSFSQAKLTGESSPRVTFYLSVVALEPDTTFKLAIMTSGQKMQPSKAIQTVDYLIDRFNTLSRSFQGPPTVNVAPVPSNPGMPQAASATRNLRNRRTPLLDGSDGESTSDVSDNADESAAAEEKVGEEGRKRHTFARGQQQPVDEAGTQELKSFQHLLETLSEKNGFEPPRSTSFLLSGPSEEHFEFVRDEELRLHEAQQQFSPPKTVDGSHAGRQDAISVVTERRLTLQGKRQKLRRVVTARLQKKLAPLHHRSQRASEGDEVYPPGEPHALETDPSPRTLTNLRVARFAPRPVAYSLTSLESLPHGHRQAKSRTALFLQPRPRHNVARSNESKRKPDEEEAMKKT